MPAKGGSGTATQRHRLDGKEEPGHQGLLQEGLSTQDRLRHQELIVRSQT